MSKHNENERVKPTDPDLLNEICSDVFKDSGFAARVGKDPATPEEKILLHAGDITKRINSLLRQILRAANDRGVPYSPENVMATAMKLTRDGFASWSKDDLLFLVTVVHSEFLLNKANEFQESLIPPGAKT